MSAGTRSRVCEFCVLAAAITAAACTADPAVTSLASEGPVAVVTAEAGIALERGDLLPRGTPVTVIAASATTLTLEWDGAGGVDRATIPVAEQAAITASPASTRDALDVCPAGWARAAYVRHLLDGLTGYDALEPLPDRADRHRGQGRHAIVAEGGRYVIAGRPLGADATDAATWFAARLGQPSADGAAPAIANVFVDAWRYLALSGRCVEVGPAQLAALGGPPVRLAQATTRAVFNRYQGYEGNTYRERNLALALDRLDGLVIAPGQSVSLVDRAICQLGEPTGAIGAHPGCYAGDHVACTPDQPGCHAECADDLVCNQDGNGCQPYFDGPRADGSWGFAGGADLAAGLARDALAQAGLGEAEGATTSVVWWQGECYGRDGDVALTNSTDRPIVVLAGSRLVERYDADVRTWVDDADAYLELWTIAPPPAEPDAGPQG